MWIGNGCWGGAWRRDWKTTNLDIAVLVTLSEMVEERVQVGQLHIAALEIGALCREMYISKCKYRRQMVAHTNSRSMSISIEDYSVQWEGGARGRIDEATAGRPLYITCRKREGNVKSVPIDCEGSVDKLHFSFRLTQSQTPVDSASTSNPHRRPDSTRRHPIERKRTPK